MMSFMKETDLMMRQMATYSLFALMMKIPENMFHSLQATENIQAHLMEQIIWTI